jgi:hypothetical protein
MTALKLYAGLEIFRQYLFSRSTQIALVAGIMMYIAYAATHRQWLNPALIGVSTFISLFLPWYSKLSNKAEEKINLLFPIVTLGRLSRFIFQLAFNAFIFLAFESGAVLGPQSFDGVGGIIGISVLTTIESQGAQYIAIILFNRGVGDLNRNVMCALAANILITAAATTGFHLVKIIFIIASLVLGTTIFGIGILSDVRSRLFPRNGIGLFFGTFNPFHVTHVAIVKRAIAERGLSKVIIHSTIVPRLHALALQRGEIRVARVERGLQVMERTEKADLNVNYFPTGNLFYPPETRKLLVDLSIEEAGLKDLVEVLWLPDVYEQRGFYGVIDAVRRMHPGRPLHGLHGSDLGGMWVRGIYDESGWIYPFPVRRRDGISATAIRSGAKGMTASAVTEVLNAFGPDEKVGRHSRPPLFGQKRSRHLAILGVNYEGRKTQRANRQELRPATSGLRNPRTRVYRGTALSME